MKSSSASADLCKVSIGLDVQKHQSPLSIKKSPAPNPGEQSQLFAHGLVLQNHHLVLHSQQPQHATQRNLVKWWLWLFTAIGYDSYDYQAIPSLASFAKKRGIWSCRAITALPHVTITVISRNPLWNCVKFPNKGPSSVGVMLYPTWGSCLVGEFVMMSAHCPIYVQNPCRQPSPVFTADKPRFEWLWRLNSNKHLCRAEAGGSTLSRAHTSIRAFSTIDQSLRLIIVMDWLLQMIKMISSVNTFTKPSKTLNPYQFLDPLISTFKSDWVHSCFIHPIFQASVWVLSVQVFK